MSTLDKKRINAVRKLEELGYRFNDNGMVWEGGSETKQESTQILGSTTSPYRGINLAPVATPYIPDPVFTPSHNFFLEVMNFWGRCVLAQDKVLVLDVWNMLDAVKKRYGL